MINDPVETQSWCWNDGELSITAEARIGVLDRGFLFGDSVFETFTVVDGQGVFVDDHLRRLQQSARKVKIPLVYSHEALLEIIDQVIGCHDHTQKLVLRVTLTRGDRLGGEIGIENCQPRLVVLSNVLEKEADSQSSGLTAMVVQQKKVPPDCLSPGMKSGNYLNGILARSEAQESGVDEAIMLSMDGVVTEASCSNLFWIRAGVVYTCSDDLVLAGITRSKIISILEEQEIKCAAGHFTEDHLLSAHSAFLTNSVRGVQRVSQLNGSDFRNVDAVELVEELSRLYQIKIAESVSRRVR